MSHDDSEFEPIAGLPAVPPEGEEILWQGAPQWRPLARRAFKLPWLAAYFAVLVAAQLVSTITSGSFAGGLARFGTMFAVFAVGLGLVVLLAWLHARATMYTITSQRVVMRIGVALPITWNLPLSRIAAADLVKRDDGDGDVVLRLVAGDRVRWFHFWPHARRGRWLRACPTLRGLTEPDRVAAVLGRAARGCGVSTASVSPDRAATPTAPTVTPTLVGGSV